MIRSLYNTALFLTLVAGTPYWLFRVLTERKYREGLRERLGGAPSRLRAGTESRRVLWLHAVSVGEVIAVSRLVQMLDEQAPELRVVISTTTRTGQALARERFGAERCFYFPIDAPWAVQRTFRILRPLMLVLAESEFWPNVLATAQRTGTSVVVVNGRISDRSWPRYLRLRRVWQPFLQALSLVLAQSEKDAARFVRIGVPAERVKVSGNLKFDVRTPLETPIVGLLRGHLPAGARVLVCGSTLEGEETMLLDAWAKISAQRPGGVIILAPRHPERFGRIADLLSASGRLWVRRSQWAQSPAPLLPGSIFLLDSIGDLAALYALGTVAFIGGSLVEAGGHNPLEPAQFGVPVVMGPHYENFSGILELLRAHDAIAITTQGSLDVTLRQLLQDTTVAEQLGARGREVFFSEAGATQRTFDAVLQLVGKSGAGQ